MDEFGNAQQVLAAGGLAKVLVDVLRKFAPDLAGHWVLLTAAVISLLLNIGTEYVQSNGVMTTVQVVQSLVFGVFSFVAAVSATELQKSVETDRGMLTRSRDRRGRYVRLPKEDK